jgi:hypothetical protein
MSSVLVTLVAVIYLLASASCVVEGKWPYALLNLFWGGGNLVIVYLMGK